MSIKSLAEFSKSHTATYLFVQNKLTPALTSDAKFIVVEAPVKSGKRTIVEITSLIHPSAKHIFLTALNRTADKSQHAELASYLGSHAVHVICRKNKIAALFKYVNKILKSGKQIIMHHDELDYASGAEHNMMQIWNTLKDFPEVKWIMYSASPEEVLHSDWYVALDSLQKCHVKYTPPGSYKGADYFLTNDLVSEAEPFFVMDEDGEDIELSDQACEIITDLCESAEKGRRHILVVRLATMRIYKYAKELISSGAFDELNECDVLFAHGGPDTDHVPWDSPSWWEKLDHNTPLIIFIDQVSSRSTEWAGHPYIYALHDFASPKTPYNTIMQRQLRVAHYTTKSGVTGYNGKGHPIRVYGTVDVFKLAAGKITYDEFSRKLSTRTATSLSTKTIAQASSDWDVPLRVTIPADILAIICEKSKLRGASKEFVMNALQEIAPDYLEGYHLYYVRRYAGEKTAADNDKLEKFIASAACGKPDGLHGGRATDRDADIYYLDVVLEQTGKHVAGTAVLTKCIGGGNTTSSKSAYMHKTTARSMFSTITEESDE